MTLTETLASMGMTPPRNLIPGRWLRFPGIGKGKSNRSGWCRVISPTLAIYGDWSSGLTATWQDSTHRDSVESGRLLAEARRRERIFAAEQVERQRTAARRAEEMIRAARIAPHPYLTRKGFPDRKGLTHLGKLLVPVRDSHDYSHIISVQLISETEKLFLPGGRTRGGVYRLGVPMARAKRVVLCEGYATGLSIESALERLPGPHTVIVCFSARNLEVVAEQTPGALICADNDASGVGETSARRTGLKWVMPPNVGQDFNDLHRAKGLAAVMEVLREA